MKSKQRVNYILWSRNDAVGKVTKILLEKLENKVDLKMLKLNFISERRCFKSFFLFINSIRIIPLLMTNKIIHFEEPKQLELLLNIFRNKKSVLTVHHLEEEEKGIRGKIIFLMYKLLHKSFSKFIAISEKTKKDLIEQYGINPDKIEVVYHGVDKKIFRPTKKKVSPLKNKKYILYLGSEVPRKNIENLLKAFKKVSEKYPDLYLVKAGYSGGDQFREKTKKLVKELGLTKKVILVSKRLKEEELPLYYSNAELFVYPTLQEGFGMPLVESMACGCPVVTSDIAPMNEITKGQVLVNPYNSKDIVKGIDKILSNRKYKNKLIQKAKQRAKDFDWEKSAKKILRVYEELEKDN